MISPKQFGFIDRSSTLSACMELTNEIETSIEEKFFAGCLLIDVKKVFDCVNHSILLKKLKKCGIVNTELRLFQSYLTNRRQLVKIDDHVSKEESCTIGIPQGAILAPTLFNIYINDICLLKLKGKIQLYADDAIVIYKSQNVKDLLIDIQSVQFVRNESK